MRHGKPSTKATFRDRLRAHEVERVWAQDEGRFGLKVWFRRRWCPFCERPPWIFTDRYCWCWVYAAVEPSSGASVVLLLPGMDTACQQIFLDTLAAALPGERVGVVQDGAGAHRATALRWPDNLVRLPLPSYAPELNPVETLFRHLRGRLANRIFADLDELETVLTVELQHFWSDRTSLQSLTGYSWWVKAVVDMHA
jgi:transposase